MSASTDLGKTRRKKNEENMLLVGMCAEEQEM